MKTAKRICIGLDGYRVIGVEGSPLFLVQRPDGDEKKVIAGGRKLNLQTAREIVREVYRP